MQLWLTHPESISHGWSVCQKWINIGYLRLKIKMPRARNGLVLLELLAVEVLQTSLTSQAVPHALGFPPEFGGKTILMKTPSTWVRDHADIKQVLTWKLHPYWLAFILQEHVIHATGGEEESEILPSREPCSYNNDCPGTTFPLLL